MGTTFLVSVIIPVYNVAEYLSECLDSILAQVYPGIEIIIINDGSTDNSSSIIEEYKSKYENIFLYEQENSGLSAARNLGIDNANGNYLCFVDSDDAVHPFYIQNLIDSCLNFSVDLSICSYSRDYLDFQRLLKNNDFVSSSIIMERKELFSNLFNENGVVSSTFFATWNKLYHKDLFKELRFPIGRLYEDNFFTPTIFKKINKAVFINMPLYYYRVRDNSITSLSFPNELNDQLDGLESLHEIVGTEFVSNKEFVQLYWNRKTNLLLEYFYFSPMHKTEAKKFIFKNIYQIFLVMRKNDLLKFYKLLIKLTFNF